MKIKTVINPDYYYISEYTGFIVDNFDQIGELLHSDRNDVRAITINNTEFVIKYFKKITLANRLIYGLIRKSKAQRAYENANILINNGFLTPTPAAYIDCYQNGILRKSFFVSIRVDYQAVDILFKQSLAVSESPLREFARFSYKLHKAGIFHDDYHPYNVLYNQTLYGYDFYLIDNNRIRFRKYTRKRGLQNLRRIHLPIEKDAIVASEYACLLKKDAPEVLQHILFYQLVSVKFLRMKRTVKKFFKTIVKNFFIHLQIGKK